MSGQEEAYAVANDLGLVGALATRALTQQTRYWSMMGLRDVKQRANTGHHRVGEPHIPGTGPGPNRASGDYTRSMNVEFVMLGGVGFAGTIGTNAAQARRLENGFHGVDAIGRHYRQDAFPHWGPMGDWLEGQFYRGVEHGVFVALVNAGF